MRAYREEIFRFFLERINISPSLTDGEIIRELDSWLNSCDVGKVVEKRTIADRVIEKSSRPKNAD